LVPEDVWTRRYDQINAFVNGGRESQRLGG
jgi:hypothetical protein